jgi:hypothetical protein
MDKKQAPMDVTGDVLHIPSQTKLTPEQIAKAVAHHNRHHPQARPAQQSKTTAQTAPGKKIR